MDQIKIGKFIASCRKEQGMTQAALAEKLGISDQAVSKWETGKSMPDLDKISELCGYLGIDVNELLSGEKLTMEQYKEHAERNLIETLSSSSFTLKEKIEFYKKKWLKEHIAFMVMLAVIIVAMLVAGVIMKNSVVIAIAVVLFPVFHVIRYNSMMIYVERSVYDASGNQQ
ncbi:MAG: helix-turn-helix domain-containing protein [Defluviitoga tunisiensis]